MSFYDNDNAWSGQGRQPSWEQPQHTPSRSGVNSAMSFQSEPNAFAAQFEEIERATDNLMRSGKWLPGAVPGVPLPGRRDSVPTSTRGYEHGGDHRSSSRHHQSNSEFDATRPGSAGLQNYYAGQRFPTRQSEAEQMLQAKRRMAAQRERELRNYHQEQQYNRTSSTAKPDRAMSPNTMSEEDRRELIARQHRALYGDGSNLYNPEHSASRSQSQDISGRGASPFDPYNPQTQPGAESAVQMPPRERAESTASPLGNVNPQQSLSDVSQHARASTTSPAASPPLQTSTKGGNSGVAPIGTRPPQNAGAVGGLNKRATTPLAPSSLSYGYSNAETQNVKDERSASAAPNPQAQGDKGPSALGGSAWGNNSGVWGKNSLSNQASVWG